MKMTSQAEFQAATPNMTSNQSAVHPVASPLAVLTDLIAPEMSEVEQLFETELASDLLPVKQLVKHVSRFRGKMLRPMLVLLAGKATSASHAVTPAHVTVATVVEMVHMATLVHDDVLDDAELRRRGATINHLKGNEAAVILGDFLISHSYHLCSSLQSQFCARVVSATTNRVCEGELLQLHNRNNVDLTEAVYFDIISRKTAALTASSAMLGAHLSGADAGVCENLRVYGESLGVAFQIQDDILDLVGDAARVGKSLGSDIDKVKLTLPLIHFLSTAPQQHRQLLRSLLSGNEPDRAEKVKNLIAPTGSVEYAKKTAQAHVDTALSAISGLPDSPAKRALEHAARMVTMREV
jgi:octaprenyl-diphosphate synthase